MTKTKTRNISERSSITMNLPQWDLDTKNHALVSSTGVLEGGIEVVIPSTVLSGIFEQERIHSGFVQALRNALPEGERARFYLEVAPAGTEIIDNYAGIISDDAPRMARAFKGAKVEALNEGRLNGMLRGYRAFVMFTASPRTGFGATMKRALRKSYAQDEYDALAKQLNTTRVRLLTAFTSFGARPVGMKADELFAIAWRYHNPHERTHKPPKFVPTKAHLSEKVLRKNPGAADRTLRSQLTRTEMRRGFEYLRTSDHYTGIISMENLPVGNSYTNMGNILLHLPGSYWLVIDLQHEPQGETLRTLHARARRMSAAATEAVGPTDYIDPGNRVGAAETDGALMQIAQYGSHVFNLSLSIVLTAHTHEGLQNQTDRVTSTLTNLPGLTYTRESFGLLDQFLRLAPGSGQPGIRQFLTLEETAAAFLPTSMPWEGNRASPVVTLETRNQTLAGVDPFDPKSANWNGIVVGGSGSGKTFFMQMYANELITQGANVVIVDRGNGYKHLVDLHGGRTIILQAGESSINPFDLPPGDFAPSDEKRSFLLSLLKTMIRVSDGELSGATDTILTAAIEQTYQRATRQAKDAQGKEIIVSDGCQLSGLLNVLLKLEAIGDRTASQEDRQQAQRIATILQSWTGDTPLGKFLDRPTNLDLQGKVLAFETTALTTDPKLGPVAIMLLANLIWERAQKNHDDKTIVIFDEVWTLLSIPEAASFIVELYRRFRRYNAAAYTVTQSLEDFLTPEARGIIQSTTHFYLMQLQGEDATLKDLFHLNADAMHAFRDLTAVRGEFSETLAWLMRQGSVEGGILRIKPHPLEYWAFTTTARDMSLREAALERHHGNLLAALLELAEMYPKGAP